MSGYPLTSPKFEKGTSRTCRSDVLQLEQPIISIPSLGQVLRLEIVALNYNNFT
jgi:hypothetical protein